MSALHKAAWAELIVSVLAVLGLVIFYPLIGDHSIGALWLLFGGLGISLFFKIAKTNKVICDERDREIQRLSLLYGYSTAWCFLTICLLAIALWHTWSGQEVPAKYCIALVYIQCAVLIGAKSASAVVCYWKGQHAT